MEDEMTIMPTKFQLQTLSRSLKIKLLIWRNLNHLPNFLSSICFGHPPPLSGQTTLKNIKFMIKAALLSSLSSLLSTLSYFSLISLVIREAQIWERESGETQEMQGGARKRNTQEAQTWEFHCAHSCLLTSAFGCTYIKKKAWMRRVRRGRRDDTVVELEAEKIRKKKREKRVRELMRGWEGGKEECATNTWWRFLSHAREREREGGQGGGGEEEGRGIPSHMIGMKGREKRDFLLPHTYAPTHRG